MHVREYGAAEEESNGIPAPGLCRWLLAAQGGVSRMHSRKLVSVREARARLPRSTSRCSSGYEISSYHITSRHITSHHITSHRISSVLDLRRASSSNVTFEGLARLVFAPETEQALGIVSKQPSKQASKYLSRGVLLVALADSLRRWAGQCAAARGYTMNAASRAKLAFAVPVPRTYRRCGERESIAKPRETPLERTMPE